MDVLGDRINFPDPRYLPIDTSGRESIRDVGSGGDRPAGGGGVSTVDGTQESLPCSATTADPTGDGILIQLAYTNANASGRAIGNQNHAFVIAIDPSTGQMYASRGGPGSGPGGGPAGGPTDFVAVSGALDRTFPDRLSEVHSVQTVGRLAVSFVQVKSYMNAFAAITNSNGLHYLGPVQNSNSYAFALVDGMGFERPNPAVPAIGSGTNGVDSRMSCARP